MYPTSAQLSYNPTIAFPTEVRADFPPDAASARQARRFVEATLSTWSCDGVVDVATLLVSELVANAVLHAHTTIGVVLRLQRDRIRVEVHDGDQRAPAVKRYSTMATTGRGLQLVERLAQNWGVTRAARGKAVWFELDTAPAADASAAAFAFDLDAADDLELFGAGPPPRGDAPTRPPERAAHRGAGVRAGLRLLVGVGVP